LLPESDNNEIAAGWDHMHKYSPAPRHRRNIIIKMLDKIKFSNCLDAGCAQGYLLHDIVKRYQVKGFGCDISCKVINANRANDPDCEFSVINLETESWPHEMKFDVIVSSEVIEHIKDWQSAIKNLISMTGKYLLITVPGGNLRTIDKMVGHHRHFNGPELIAEITQYGFSCELTRHGFPMHSLYKKLINFIMPQKIYEDFSGIRSYTFSQRLISQCIYYLFFVNYFFRGGEQLFVLAKRVDSE